jgi:hypothetical protein
MEGHIALVSGRNPQERAFVRTGKGYANPMPCFEQH